MKHNIIHCLLYWTAAYIVNTHIKPIPALPFRNLKMTSHSIKYFCAIAGIFFLCSPTHADTMTDDNKQIIFFGDSITQSGDTPGGYVTQVRDTIKTLSPSSNVNVLGAGISGNKVPDRRTEVGLLGALSREPAGWSCPVRRHTVSVPAPWRATRKHFRAPARRNLSLSIRASRR